MTRILLVALLAGSVLLAGATGAAGAPPAPTGLPPDVVLHVETGPGPFSPAGPEVTVHADGRVLIDRVTDAPEHVELAIGSDGVEQLLDAAVAAGALRDFDFGDADITDQATTTVEVVRGDRHRRHSVYALVFSGAGYSSGDHPLSDAQIEARSRLARFVLDVGDPATFERWEQLDHPTGADDVVFRTSTERNGWGGEYPHAVTVTVYGDGRVVSGDGTERHWSERRLQRFLRAARRIGLLGDAEYGEALVTDQGTTTVEIHAGGIDRGLGIYALELPEGDHGLPRAEREARRDLRRLIHRSF